MNSNSTLRKNVSKDKKLKSNLSKHQNQTKKNKNILKVSKSSKIFQLSKIIRSKSRSLNQKSALSQNKNAIQNKKMEIAVGAQNKSTFRSQPIDKLSEKEKDKNPNLSTHNLVIYGKKNENSKKPIEIIEITDNSQILSQIPNQDDLKTQSIMISQNPIFQKTSSANSKTTLSKKKALKEKNKTPPILTKEVESNEIEISEDNSIYSNIATKSNSSINKSENGMIKITNGNKQINKTQQPEINKIDSNSKKYSSDKKTSNNEGKALLRSKSDIKSSKNISDLSNKMNIEQIFKNDNNEKKCMVELKEIDSKSLLRKSPSKKTDYITNVQRAKDNGTEMDKKSKTKQSV